MKDLVAVPVAAAILAAAIVEIVDHEAVAAVLVAVEATVVAVGVNLLLAS